jgi:hypothetical protein
MLSISITANMGRHARRRESVRSCSVIERHSLIAFDVIASTRSSVSPHCCRSVSHFGSIISAPSLEI